MIKNIKSSHIIQCSEKWRNYLIQKAKSLNFECSQRGNILIVKKDFNLCIFEKTSNKTEKDQIRHFKEVHINLSGVKSFTHQEEILIFVLRSFFEKDAFILHSKVDNITAAFSYPRPINLTYIKSTNPECKYNKERFPGLFMKFRTGTSIVFHSGKINIVGAKSEQEVLQTWRMTNHYLLLADMQIRRKLKDV